MSRILVTGSRDWPDFRVVYDALNKHVREGDVVVHGASGNADMMARRWCVLTGTEQEQHPCNKECEIHGRAHMWKTLGKAAGPMRNQAMVLSGIDLCLAFPLGTEWSGTRDCMRRAVDAIGQERVINCGDQ